MGTMHFVILIFSSLTGLEPNLKIYISHPWILTVDRSLAIVIVAIFELILIVLVEKIVIGIIGIAAVVAAVVAAGVAIFIVMSAGRPRLIHF